MSYAAFFDFDGTIYKSIINVEFVKYAIMRKKIRYAELTKRFPRIIYFYFLNKFNLINRLELNKRIYKEFKGLNRRLFVDNSEDFYNRHIKGKIYKGAHNLIAEHKKKNAKIVVLTSSFNDILEPIKNRVGIDFLIAPKLESIKGIYTGKIIQLPIGIKRKEAVIKFSKENKIALSKSYSYSDHFSDIPMLESVGIASVINPDKRLKKKAINCKWRIYHFNELI